MAALSLRDLPELPTNSVIQVEETPERLELRWLNPRRNPFGDRAALLVGLFVLGFWAVAGAVLGWQLGRSLPQEVPSPEAFGWLRIAVLGVAAVVGVLASLHLVVTLGPRRAEVLVLSHDRLLHRRGSPPSFARALRDRLRQDWKGALKRGGIRTVTRAEFWRRLFPLRRTVRSKSEITEVTLAREAGRPQLRLVIGMDAIEVGRYLSEADREWLAEVLRLWLESG